MMMKVSHFTSWAVVTADQRHSRRSTDQVPEALAALAEVVGDRVALPFERTVGDELQALTRDPGAVVDAVVTLTRLPGWHVGIGLGAVETPWPGSTREARGTAYLAARQAVEQARSAPANLRLIAAESVGDPTYGGSPGPAHAARRAEAALVLLRALVGRRTREGWEIVDVLERTGSGRAAARHLGISPSAVSQRASRSARAESSAGAWLARSLLAEAMGVSEEEQKEMMP